MTEIVIRNLDEAVLERLKVRARQAGTSLDQCLRDILSNAVRPTREELLAEMKAVQSMTPAPPPDARWPTAEAMIREDRDRR